MLIIYKPRRDSPTFARKRLMCSKQLMRTTYGFARRATYSVCLNTALRVSDLCARGGLCVRGTAFACKRLKLEGLTI